MPISDMSEKKNKSTTFVSNSEENEDQCVKDTEEGLSDDITLLDRKFNKALKILDRRPMTYVEEKVLENFKNICP